MTAGGYDECVRDQIVEDSSGARNEGGDADEEQRQ